MAEMIFGQTIGINVPAGRYVARFVGTEEREDFVGTMGKNAGKPMPRMAWVFEVMEGEHRGERIPQETGTSAVIKSVAIRMLTGLNGGPLAVGQKVNTDAYVGRLYSLKVAPNPESTKGNLHIADLEPVGNTHPAAPTPPRPPAPSAPPPPPPPAAKAPPPPKAPPANISTPEPTYWIHDGKKQEQLTADQVRGAYRTDPAAVGKWQYCDDKGAWQPVEGSFLTVSF